MLDCKGTFLQACVGEIVLSKNSARLFASVCESMRENVLSNLRELQNACILSCSWQLVRVRTSKLA